MTLETFRNALDASYDCVTLGGGEPTMHPMFMTFLHEVFSHPKRLAVLVITNGSNKKIALHLASLNRTKEDFRAKVSVDDFHDPIDQEVKDAFGESHCHNPNKYSPPYKMGRWLETIGEITEDVETCVTDGNIIKPNGDIFQCACNDAPSYGNVNTGIDWDGFYISTFCHKSQDYVMRMKEYKEVLEDFHKEYQRKMLNRR